MNYKNLLSSFVILLLIFYFALIFQVKLKDCEFGDSGLMFLQTLQFLESSPKTIAFDYKALDIDTEMNFLPFQKPFIAIIQNKAYIDFPPYFPILNSFFFQILGDKGLYIWSFLGLFGTVLLFTKILLETQIPTWISFLTILLFSFGSSLPIYNLFYHEYPIAIFFSSLSFYFFLNKINKKNFTFSFWFGFFSGLSLFFRLELVFVFVSLGLAEVLFQKESLKQKVFFVVYTAVGFIIPFSLLLALNQVLHFHPLGLRYVLNFSYPAHLALKRSEILFGLFSSKTRGVFFQTPYMFFPFFILLFIWKKENFLTEKKLSFSIVLSLLLISFLAPNDGAHFAPRYFFGLYIPTLFFIASFFSKLEVFSSFLRKIFYLVLILSSLVSILFWKKNLKWTLHMQKEVKKFTQTLEENTQEIIVFYDYAYPLNSINLYPKRKYLVAEGEEKLKNLLELFIQKKVTQFEFIFNPVLQKPNLKVFEEMGFQTKEKYKDSHMAIFHCKI